MSYRKVKKGNARRPVRTSGRVEGPASGAGRRKGGGGTGKKILLAILIVFLVSFVGGNVVSFFRSSSRGQCKAVISDFQTACNEQSVNGILNCLTPSVSNPLRIALGIGSIATSQSSDEMFEGILDALGGGLGGIQEKTGLSVKSLFETMEIRPQSYGFPKKTRRVRCRANIGGIEQQIYIYVTKQYGESYISKISFARQ